MPRGSCPAHAGQSGEQGPRSQPVLSRAPLRAAGGRAGHLARCGCNRTSAITFYQHPAPRGAPAEPGQTAGAAAGVCFCLVLVSIKFTLTPTFPEWCTGWPTAPPGAKTLWPPSHQARVAPQPGGRGVSPRPQLTAGHRAMLLPVPELSEAGAGFCCCSSSLTVAWALELWTHPRPPVWLLLRFGQQ